MKKVRRITAATEEASKLDMIMDAMEEDFDYFIDGLRKLDRTDATASNQGLVIAEAFNKALQTALDSIADAITE